MSEIGIYCARGLFFPVLDGLEMKTLKKYASENPWGGEYHPDYRVSTAKWELPGKFVIRHS